MWILIQIAIHKPSTLGISAECSIHNIHLHGCEIIYWVIGTQIRQLLLTCAL